MQKGVQLEIEFSSLGAEKEINIRSQGKSSDKVLEAYKGQGSVSWSWYLSFESL